ncbi:hypothetical protein C8R46DRAFT_881156 [Mycena filopes]|nr:hypothetical protein C8R46DRAFT_881156 [Mycena filopes]
MADPPSTKRKRVEPDSPDTPASAPIRSKIWKPFGDIILQAESTQFRVSRDILAGQSSVFRDMFGVPQPPNEPTIEGCPIVLVSDTAQDWELLFEVLYDRFQSAVSRPFPVVAAMLRLGKKYEMQGPKEDALKRIHFEFPKTLKEFDSDKCHWSMITHENDLDVHLLNLLYECGVYSAIPTLGLACLDSQTLVRKTGDDRAAGHIRNTSHRPRTYNVLPNREFELASYEGRYSSQIMQIIGRLQKEQKAVCYTIAGDEAYRPLGYTLNEWKHGAWAGKLCHLCEATAREAYETNRQKGWDLLPTFFGLPQWPDLKDADCLIFLKLTVSGIIDMECVVSSVIEQTVTTGIQFPRPPRYIPKPDFNSLTAIPSW